MGFLNSTLLFGALLAVVPLILYWWNRHQVTLVHWAAMHLFESELDVKTSRFDWKTLLLLLARCAIPVCLAICLARPVLMSFKLPTASGRQAIAFVIDDSLSMSEGMGSESSFAVAKREIFRIADAVNTADVGLWRGAVSPLALIRLSGKGSQSVQQALDSLRANCGPLNIPPAINAANSFLDSRGNVGKHLVIVSDFKKVDWSSFITGPQENLFARGVQLHLLNVGPRLSNSDNLSIHSKDSNTYRCIVGQPLVFEFTVVNHSLTERSARVNFKLGAKLLESQELELRGGETRSVKFAIRIDEEGEYLLEAAMNDETFMADNRESHQIKVEKPPRVLLVCQDENDFLVSTESASYLELALAPFQSMRTNSQSESSPQWNRFAISKIESGDFRSQLAEEPDSLSDYGVIILLEVGGLNEMLGLTRSYVESGGGLLIIPSCDDARASAQSAIASTLLPGKFVELIEQENPLRIDSAPIQTSGFDVFNSASAGDLSEIGFERHWKLGLGPKANSPLRLSNGDSLLAGKALGQGRVVMTAASVSMDSSDMALRPAFVSLMQIATQYCLGNVANPNIKCGESFSIGRLDPGSEIAETQVPILQIEGSEESVSLKAIDGDWVLQNSRQPGRYTLKTADPQMQQSVVVRCEPTESDLSPLEEAELLGFAAQYQGDVIRSAEQFGDILSEQKNGKEVWRWFLAAILMCVLMESFLAGQLTRGAR